MVKMNRIWAMTVGRGVLIRTENVDEEVPLSPVTMETGGVGDQFRKLPQDSEGVVDTCTAGFGA